MSHIRRQIREGVVAALKAANVADGRVFETRMYNLDSATLPAVCVFTIGESSAPMHKTGATPARVLLRSLQVAVMIYAAASDDLDDTLDALAVQAETAIEGAGLFGGLILQQTLTTSEFALDDERENPVGLMRLTYVIDYTAAEGAPETVA